MKNMTLRLDSELAERLGIVARVDNKPVADVIREAITRYVATHIPASPIPTERDDDELAWALAFPKDASDPLGVRNLPSPWEAFKAGRSSRAAASSVSPVGGAVETKESAERDKEMRAEGWEAAVAASRYSYENTRWFENPYRPSVPVRTGGDKDGAENGD